MARLLLLVLRALTATRSDGPGPAMPLLAVPAGGRAVPAASQGTGTAWPPAADRSRRRMTRTTVRRAIRPATSFPPVLVPGARPAAGAVAGCRGGSSWPRRRR